MEVEMKLEGFKELMTQMDIFASPRLQQKILENSTREAIRVVKDEAVKRSGHDKKAIITRRIKKGWATSFIAGYGLAFAKKHWYLVFKEYGTRTHMIVAGRVLRKRGGTLNVDVTGTRKRGKWRRGMGGEKEFWLGSGKEALAFYIGRRLVFSKWAKIPALIAKPFLRPALDSQKEKGLNKMKQYIELCLKALFEATRKDVPTVPEVN